MKRLLLILLFVPIMLQAQWNQIGNDIDGESVNDTSGFEIDLNSEGDIVAIGSFRNDDAGNDAGHVRVFQSMAGTWTQLGNDINGVSDNDNAGSSLSLNASGDIVAVGSPANSDGGNFSGQVRIFQYNGSEWVQLGNSINGNGNVNGFGSSVSLSSDGNTVAIGEFADDTNGSNAGAARAFTFDGSNWNQVGQTVYGDTAGDFFGTTISLSSDGSIFAVGAPDNDGLINAGGQVKIFQNIAGTWTQLGNAIYGNSVSGLAGYSLDLSYNGQIVAVGAVNDSEGGALSGSVTVYEYNGTDWAVKGAKISGDATSIQSGYSTSLNGSGSVVAIGDIGTNAFAGRGRVFQFDGTNWNQVGAGILGEATNDQSGYSIALNNSGSTVAIGAINNDGNGSNSGHVRVFYEPTLSVISINQETFKLYPNPSHDLVTIDFPNANETYTIEVFDILGKQVNRLNSNQQNSIRMNISDLPSGLYLVHIKSELTKRTIKLIIE